ncbi:MAG: hypothetical protein IJ053_04635 [Lachnospiraceae bacterium]|nr:hypothetical protein [Lachnospiraceae bacterium]
MYYRECEFCGSNLDPQERCDCREELERKKMEIKNVLDDSEPQLKFKFAVDYKEREDLAS